eukprot:c10938_g1_i3.p1 GENE.c10938_g1_i3~~c10938_g1_i3.p1  ORF type:complete len:323 (+),score=57.68 c10938_g1_i3:40-969(+)
MSDDEVQVLDNLNNSTGLNLNNDRSELGVEPLEPFLPLYCADLSMILNAFLRISPMINVTPVVKSRTFNEMTGLDVVFKCENMQRTGSFKFRGAINSVLQLTDAQRSAGVITHSSGNHGQAIALAAKCANTNATVVVPSTAPKIKIAAIAGYGAKIVECEPTPAAREKACADATAETGATFIHPSNEPTMVAGHASIAIELLQQLGLLPESVIDISPQGFSASSLNFGRDVTPLDAVIVPVGGGGLISGVALGLKYLSPHTRVYGAEPEVVNDANVIGLTHVAGGTRCGPGHPHCVRRRNQRRNPFCAE